MPYRFLADAIVFLHFLFVIFVVAGGFLALRWRRLIWIHLPACLWGAAIEFGGWICPLTPLENRLRSLAGQSGYPGGFIQHYVLPIVYPADLTRELQIVLGIGVVAVNLAAYALRWSRRRRAG